MGVVDLIIFGLGGSVVLVYYDGEKVCFVVVIEGENNIWVGVRYCFNE